MNNLFGLIVVALVIGAPFAALIAGAYVASKRMDEQVEDALGRMRLQFGNLSRRLEAVESKTDRIATVMPRLAAITMEVQSHLPPQALVRSVPQPAPKSKTKGKTRKSKPQSTDRPSSFRDILRPVD